MGYPVDGVYSPGGTDVGMQTSTMKYVPTLYAGKLLVKFYEASVLGEIANTDYEGMIKDQGDTVVIRTLPTINVSDHEKGMVLYQALVVADTRGYRVHHRWPVHVSGLPAHPDAVQRLRSAGARYLVQRRTRPVEDRGCAP